MTIAIACVLVVIAMIVTSSSALLRSCSLLRSGVIATHACRSIVTSRPMAVAAGDDSNGSNDKRQYPRVPDSERSRRRNFPDDDAWNAPPRRPSFPPPSSSSWGGGGSGGGGSGGGYGRDRDRDGGRRSGNDYGGRDRDSGSSRRDDGFRGGRGGGRERERDSSRRGSSGGGGYGGDSERNSFNRGGGGGGGGSMRNRGRDNNYHRQQQQDRSDAPDWQAKYDARPREDALEWGEWDGDHLYGVSPVKAALQAGHRQFSELLVQDTLSVEGKKDSDGAQLILDTAAAKGISIRRLPKHALNMLSSGGGGGGSSSGSKPHQGFVLRASAKEYCRLSSLQPFLDAATATATATVAAGEEGEEKTAAAAAAAAAARLPPVVLALDEVWDPMNLGALLRTAHFLGASGVVVCRKNSAPLSPTTSKASSGAMETMHVYGVDNLMKFLDNSVEQGWQVIGTALTEEAVAMTDVPINKPTVLVLGNEGHGLRTNILRRCTHVVKIAGDVAAGGGGDGGVDSLNVSVTGGILMHHALSTRSHSSPSS